ncbi:hypothetical protein [Fusobacterium periodonticum]|uniref:Uncharacterized protein n=1 Tax=Fusobacterium periodonticum ATCC 33693 TaxID=546275 RepID=D4CXI7_9FUSO|nr:hypothetical protein [Fusobacterium periodonticum]EFE86107.1 hypothetical protein FUSPEROL_02148 [Fusobacterium periodonticum ATCC 33693]
MYKLVMVHNKEKMYYEYEVVNQEYKMINNKSFQLIPNKIFKNLNEIFLFINIRGNLLTKEQKIDLFLNSKFVEEKIKNKIRLYYNL